MNDYRYELGFDQHAAPLRHTASDENLFPLQASLVDVTKGQLKPAWVTKLSPGDSLSIRLLDISNLALGTGDDPERFPVPEPLSFSLDCADPRDHSRTLDVFEPSVSEWAREPFRGPSPVYTTARQTFVGVDFRPTHGQILKVGALHHEAHLLVELSFRVVFGDGLLRRIYVHDPEMIVSGTGNVGLSP